MQWTGDWFEDNRRLMIEAEKLGLKVVCVELTNRR